MAGALALGFGAMPQSAVAQAKTVELPLTGPAFYHAQAAFAAYDRKDYPKAVAEAQEALRQRPDVRRLKRLLVYALAAEGKRDEAAAAARRFIVAGDTDPALRMALTQIRQASRPPEPAPPSPGYEAAQRAYALYAEQRYEAAAAAAGEALKSQPDNAAYQRLLAQAEAAWHAAQPPPGQRAAQRAYTAMRTKAYGAAASFAATAVQEAPRNRDDRRLLAEALLSAGQFEEAIAAVQAGLSVVGPDPQLYAIRGYAEQRLGKPAAAADDFAAALAGPQSPSAERALRLALADTALATGQPARALTALSPYAAETEDYGIASRRGDALLALNQASAAMAAFRQAAAAAPPGSRQRAEMIGSESTALCRIGEKPAARALLANAARRGALAAVSPAQAGYWALAAGDDRLAARFFATAQRAGNLPARGQLDAGYAAVRLGMNTTAITYFESGLDAAAQGNLSLTPQARFELRRTVSDLDRSWGMYLSTTYGGVGVTSGSSAATTGPAPATGRKAVDHIAQTGMEIDWRVPQFGARNRRIAEVFARFFDTAYDAEGGPTGARTLQSYVGARWKPIGRINFFLEASRLWAIGKDARNDFLLRAAYSTGEGTDLRVDAPSWLTWQIYGEVDRYLVTPETVFAFEGRLGRSYRIDGIADGLVLTPFAAIGGGYDSLLATPGALGAGPGIDARLWFRGDQYHAPRSYLDISLQYRVRLGGGDNARGVFANVTLSF